MLDITDPFFSSKFSIEWAKFHISEFERRAETFINEDGCTLFTETDADQAYQLLKIKVAPMVPRSLLGHATDAIYNLRAALDQAINSVATLNRTPWDRCFFPITNRDHWMEEALSRTDKLKDKIPAEIANIVRDFKPYKGGNDLVWAMNELCNASKHGLLRPIPATINFSVTGPRTEPGQPEVFSPPIWDEVKNEMTLARIAVGPEHELKSDVAFTVGFVNLPCIENRPAFVVLNEFADNVNEIVVAIEAECKRVGLI